MSKIAVLALSLLILIPLSAAQCRSIFIMIILA